MPVFYACDGCGKQVPNHNDLQIVSVKIIEQDSFYAVDKQLKNKVLGYNNCGSVSYECCIDCRTNVVKLICAHSVESEYKVETKIAT